MLLKPGQEGGNDLTAHLSASEYEVLSVPLLLSAVTLLSSAVCVVSLLSVDLSMVRVGRGEPLRGSLCSTH